MGIEFSKRAVIRVIMDAMVAENYDLQKLYDKVEAMEEPTQPELVEVPDVEQYIADWYEEHRNDTLEAKFSRAKTDKDIKVQNWYNNCEGRHVNKRANAQEIIAKMTLYGYTVKKEPMWVVAITDSEAFSGTVQLDQKGEVYRTTYDNLHAVKFTDKAKAEAVALLIGGEAVPVEE